MDIYYHDKIFYIVKQLNINFDVNLSYHYQS